MFSWEKLKFKWEVLQARTSKDTEQNTAQFHHKGFLLFFALKYLNSEEFASGVFFNTSRTEWRNIGEHGLVAGVYAEILCELFNVDDDTKHTVVRAVLLHDAFKHKEIEAFQKTQNPSEDEVAQIMGLNKQFLKRVGTDTETLFLSGANVPATSEGPQTLPEKIVWYVDAMLMGTEPTDITTRMRKAVKSLLDPDRAKRNAKIHAQKYDNGQTLHEVQIELGKRIGTEFVERLHLDLYPSDLPYYLKMLYQQKRANFDAFEAFFEFDTEVISKDSEDSDDPEYWGRLRNHALMVTLLDEYYYQIFGVPLLEGFVYRGKSTK